MRIDTSFILKVSSGKRVLKPPDSFFFALLFRVLEYAAYSWLIGPIEMHYVIAITLTSSIGYLIKYYVFSIWVFR